MARKIASPVTVVNTWAPAPSAASEVVPRVATMAASVNVNSGWATSAPKAGTASRRISRAEVAGAGAVGPSVPGGATREPYGSGACTGPGPCRAGPHQRSPACQGTDCDHDLGTRHEAAGCDPGVE